MGMEPTIKSSEEGHYILVATKVKKLNAQREADNLISKYYKKKEPTMNSNQNQGRRINSTPTHFFSDASALPNKYPTTNSYFNITRPNIMNQIPVTISFSTNTNTNQSNFGYYPSPYRLPGQNNSFNDYPPQFCNFSDQNNPSKYNHYKTNTNAKDDSSNQSNNSLKNKSTNDNNSLVTQSTVDMIK